MKSRYLLTYFKMKGWRLTLAVMYLLTQIVIVLVECHTVNKHLQIATFYNPLGRIENISTNSKGLMEKELLETLSKKMNFTYDITVSTDVLQFGFSGNESWSGVLGKLARKEADMTISFGPVSYPRFLSFDATVGIFRDHVVIMIPHPESGIDTSGLVSIFSPFTWILIAISLVIVAMALWFVNHFQHDRDDQINGGLLILYILGVTLSQGGSLPQKSAVFRMVLGAWLLALIVLTYAYTGTLKSRLTAPKHRFVINSLEDAAANKKIMPFVVKESSVQEEFMLSPTPAFQEIANRWQDHPELLLRDSNGIVDLVAKQKNRIFIGSDINAGWNIESDRKRGGKCRAILLPDKLVTRNNGLFLQKHSSLTAAFNDENLRLLQAGIARQIEVRHSPSLPACSVSSLTTHSAAPTPLRYDQLNAAFYILAGGSCVSLIVFLLEILCYYWKRFQSRPIIV